MCNEVTRSSYICALSLNRCMVIKKFSEQFIGSSFPTRIETESGEQFILKMHGAGNGPVSLVSEFIANRAAAELGWAVPDAKWIALPDNFPWTFGTDEFDDIVQKSYGWNLGITFIPNSQPLPLEETHLLSHTLQNHVFTLDVFFNNVDRTSNSLNLLRDNTGKIWMTDHGSLGLFLGFSSNGCYLFKNHFFHHLPDIGELQYDKNINNEKLFESIIYEIPEQVLTMSQITKYDLVKIIQGRIHALS